MGLNYRRETIIARKIHIFKADFLNRVLHFVTDPGFNHTASPSRLN